VYRSEALGRSDLVEVTHTSDRERENLRDGALTDNREQFSLEFGIQESSSQERSGPYRFELNRHRHEVRQIVGNFPAVEDFEKGHLKW